MKSLPETEDTLLIRTDYTDDRAWNTLYSEARTMDADVRQALEFSNACNRAEGGPAGRPIEELGTPLHVINDRDYANATCAQILSCVQPDSDHAFLFIVDKTCIDHPDHPLLVVDLYSERGRTFRAIPSQVFGIQSNLSLANLDWEEFADNVDDDGIFRGFK
jgi:hypothetical protein